MPFALRTCGRVEGEQPGNCVRPLNLAAVLRLISALVPAPNALRSFRAGVRSRPGNAVGGGSAYRQGSAVCGASAATLRPVHADSSWRVCRGRVAGYGKPGRLDAGRGRPLYLGIVVLAVGIQRVVMGGHAIRRFRSVNGRSCRQQSVPLASRWSLSSPIQ